VQHVTKRCREFRRGQKAFHDNDCTGCPTVSRADVGASCRVYPKFFFVICTLCLSRAVTGLLTGHNTLRRHLHLLGLHDIPLCRKCGVREGTSAHILCECEALASLRHAYLGSFFLELEDIRSGGLGAIWNYSKATGLP